MPDEREQTENDVRRDVARHLQAAFAALKLTATDDCHLERTAENVADFWTEFLAPHLHAARPPAVSSFPAAESSGQLILIRDLHYHSLCAHHLTPFFGAAHVAYVPDEIGVGIGAPAKLLEHFARRPQLQERLAAQLADALDAACRPRGVMVLLTARQMCMEMRGARAEGLVESVVARGCFQEAEWRAMFFARLGR